MPMIVFMEPVRDITYRSESINTHSNLKLFNPLVDRGNTVIIIEHNMELIAQADWIIDIGPYAGQEGGKLLFSGTPESMLACRHSLTAEWLRKHCQVE